MQRDIYIAAWGGRRKTVLGLLADGVDIDVAGSGGRTPLMAAASRGRVEMVRLLLEKGADAHRRDNLGQTAMDLAAFRKHITVVKVLRQANSPLSFSAAALLGEAQAMLELLMEDPDQMPDALWSAAWAGKTSVMAALLNMGGDIQQTFTRDQYTLLDVAASYGQEAMVRFLVKQRANVDAQSNTGGTALMSVIRGFGEETFQDPRKALQVLRLLIRSGANINAIDKSGHTALMYAVKHRKHDFAAILIEHGAEVELTQTHA
jgi:ankyrin repeat protein